MQEQLKKDRGLVKENFPLKLYLMLECVNDSDHSKIVSWQSHGRAFKVHNKEKFANEVLPKHFRPLGGYASFQRQLNIYGFLRLVNNGPDQGVYYHKFFLRCRPDLCELIQRNETSTHSVRCTYDETTEPDFTAYSSLQDSCASGSLHPVPESSRLVKGPPDAENDDELLGSMIDKWIAYEQPSNNGAPPLLQDSLTTLTYATVARGDMNPTIPPLPTINAPSPSYSHSFSPTKTCGMGHCPPLQPSSAVFNSVDTLDWDDTVPLRIFPNAMHPIRLGRICLD
jgi:HSF-type DNA-binding